MKKYPNKDTLTIEELKALCELFFNAGKKESDFNLFFEQVMEGRYKKWVEQMPFQEQWDQMQQNIQDHMDEWDKEARIRRAKAMQDLANIIITC